MFGFVYIVFTCCSLSYDVSLLWADRMIDVYRQIDVVPFHGSYTMFDLYSGVFFFAPTLFMSPVIVANTHGDVAEYGALVRRLHIERVELVYAWNTRNTQLGTLGTLPVTATKL